MELSDDEKDEDEFEPGIVEDGEEEEEEDAGGSDEQTETETDTDRDEQERRRPLWARSSMYVLFGFRIINSVPVISHY